jgi:serine/threonine protein kinase
MSPGAGIAHYRITTKLGEGGMGEVYRAADTRLHRGVAIKVSTARFSERFEQEARVIASLNHPHICHLYDVGPNYLVMELVEGENLTGPLPWRRPCITPPDSPKHWRLRTRRHRASGSETGKRQGDTGGPD